MADVLARLVTTTEALRVPLTPISLPQETTPEALCALIGELLGKAEIPALALRVAGLPLRGPLGEHVANTNTSLEAIMDIEYEPVIQPDVTTAFVAPDWVGAIAPGPKYVLAGCYDGVLRTLRPEGTELQPIAHCAAHGGPIKGVASIVLDGKEGCVTVGLDGRAVLHLIEAKKPIPAALLEGQERQPHLPPCGYMAVAVLYDEHVAHVCVGAVDGCIRVYNITAEHLVKTTPVAHIRPAQTLPGPQILSGSGDGKVAVFGCMTGKLRMIVLDGGEVKETSQTKLQGPISSLALKDGELLVGCADFRGRVYSLADGEFKHKVTFRGHKAPVTAVTWLEKRAVTGSLDGCLRIWGESPDSLACIDLNAKRAKELDVEPTSTRVDYKPLSACTTDAVLIGGSDCRVRRLTIIM